VYTSLAFASSTDYEGQLKDVWEKVGKHEFKDLINSMQARCQAVIDANDLFTKY